MVPVGGLTALEPASYCEQADLEINKVSHLLAQLRTALEDQDGHSAVQLAQRAHIQLGVMNDTLLLAERKGDLPDKTLGELRERIQSLLLNVRRVIADLAEAAPTVMPESSQYTPLFNGPAIPLPCA
jgi:hypothetical protein